MEQCNWLILFHWPSEVTRGLFIWARLTGLARFPRSRPATLSFVRKISMSSYEKPGVNEISVNLDENSPVWTNTPTRVTGTKLLDKIASLSQHSSQSGIVFVMYVFNLVPRVSDLTAQRVVRWETLGTRLVCISTLGLKSMQISFKLIS